MFNAKRNCAVYIQYLLLILFERVVMTTVEYN